MAGGVAGDVDGVHLGVVGQVGADVGRAAGDAHEPALHERRQRPVEHRLQGGVERVQLDHHHGVVLVQLGQAVQGRDRADVARPEHQGDPAGWAGVAQATRQPGLGVLHGHPGTQPHLGGVAQHQPVLGDRGEDAQRHLAAGQGPGSQPVERAGAGFEPLEEPDQGGHAHEHGVGPAQPLLAGRRGAGGDPLALAAHPYPLVRDRRGGPAHGLQQASLLRHRGRRPLPRRRPEGADVGVEGGGVDQLGLVHG